MFFRIRTRLSDRPGALARIVSRCGAEQINVLGLQIFPDVGTVVDEIVVRTPGGWNVQRLARLVASTGGADVEVESCGMEVLVDQPTRWLAAVREAREQPDLLPRLLGELLPVDREEWTPTEHARAELLAELVEQVGGPLRGQVEYAESGDAVLATSAGEIVGTAVVDTALGGEVAVAVTPAWRRSGIGTELLRRLADLARAGDWRR